MGAGELARLHVITLAGPDDEVVAAVDEVLAAGAPLVQLRTKQGTDRARCRLAAEVVQRCHAAGARCLVNDRADIAAAVGADGVHLGADDLAVAAVRVLLGAEAVVGATCRDPESARRAEAEGATYLGVGPAFATSTKGGLPAPLGPAGVSRVAAAVDLPVIAIGGVTAERVAVLLEAGAHGVAVAGAVFAAADPSAATAALLAALASLDRSGGQNGTSARRCDHENGGSRP
ncbi:MAG: thiamine phosphate synthase [Actinobacteria bacterium]|nr:thiamine phosphate synthase [Actinomycetota bacterium]